MDNKNPHNNCRSFIDILRTGLSIIILAMFVIPCQAQGLESGNDYYFRRYNELINESNDVDKAMDLLNKQLELTPRSVEVLLERSKLYSYKKEYGKAISDVNDVIKYNNRKTSVNDYIPYVWRSDYYESIEEFDKALNDAAQAYKLALKNKNAPKDEIRQIGSHYASLLYGNLRADEAKKIYNQLIQFDETDVDSQCELAFIHMQDEDYDKAAYLLNQAQKYDPTYSKIYLYQILVYCDLEQWENATDACILYFETDDAPESQWMFPAMSRCPAYALAQIKDAINNSEYSAAWRRLQWDFLIVLHYYEQAIKEMDSYEKDLGGYEALYYQRAECYSELGLMDKAIDEISKAMDDDEPDYVYLCERGDYYRLAGKYKEAIEDFSAAIREEPTRSYAYYKRGWCYDLSGDTAKALASYNTGIGVESDDCWLLLMRGELYLGMGDTARANADFRQVLKYDNIVTSNSCRHYALHFLGRDEEAIEWMNKIIEEDPNDVGNYYDRACLFSRIGRLDEAVKYLIECLDYGYYSITHIEHDDDMDPIRDRDDFKEAIAKAKERINNRLDEYNIESPYIEHGEYEIPFKRRGGVLEIQCELNGLRLPMIFDTGASEISISKTEGDFMLKNRYLSEKDIKGKKYFQNADGKVSECNAIVIHEVKIGDIVLNDVEGSITNSSNAPLLIGQSVLKQLGNITVDYERGVIVIK